jgi:hypothetical protein
MFASAGPPAITSTEQLYIHVTCVQHQQQQNVNTVKHTAAYNITRQPPPCWHVLDLFVSLQVAGCDVAASAGFDGYLAAELWLFKPQPCLQWHPWPMRVSPPPREVHLHHLVQAGQQCKDAAAPPVVDFEAVGASLSIRRGLSQGKVACRLQRAWSCDMTVCMGSAPVAEESWV